MRHIIVDTLGLVGSTVDVHDGEKPYLFVEHCLEYQARMRKILVDSAYKKVMHDWAKDNIIAINKEFSSKPPNERVLSLSN